MTAQGQMGAYDKMRSVVERLRLGARTDRPSVYAPASGRRQPPQPDVAALHAACAPGRMSLERKSPRQLSPYLHLVGGNSPLPGNAAMQAPVKVAKRRP